MGDGDYPIGSILYEHAAQLRKLMLKYKVDNKTTDALIRSGYSYHEAYSPFDLTKPVPCISDSFYGSSWLTGLIPVELFIQYLKSGNYPRFKPPTYKIKSLEHALEILNSEPHTKWYGSGRMCFRGQDQEYKTRREIPNPHIQDDRGWERLIIPAYWRRFASDWNWRRVFTPPPLLNSLYASEIIYHGIPNWQELPEINLRRYGFHTMSDLEDFPDPESREYGRRWRLHKIDMTKDSEIPVLEQHYGVPTAGLDVTFDLAVALFFASYRYKRNADGNATYKPVPKGRRKGIIYCLVFHDPPLTRTSDLITSFHTFDHMPPIRPLKQNCALPWFDAFSFNAAAGNIDAILILDKNFELGGLPTSHELFPTRKEDLFYDALLDLKAKYPDKFSDIVEYDL